MKHPAEASAEPTQTPNVTRALPPVVWSARGSGYRTNNYIRSNPYRTVRLKTYHLLSQLPRGLQGNRISDRTEIFVQALHCSSLEQGCTLVFTPVQGVRQMAT